MVTPTTSSTYLVEVSEHNFATEVLERSKTVPVVVDFWAAWCGPCRMLGPILEKLAAEANGAFVLAKLDVDSNPALASQFRVQGIPAVKAFYNGQVVGEFTGALPEPQVRNFIEGLAPSPAELLTRQGVEWETTGQLAVAAENYREALKEKPDHYPAMLGLGRTSLKLGQEEEGLAVLANIPAGVAERPEADALVATVQLRQETAGQDEAGLREKITANPNDLASRYSLAGLLTLEERYPEALDEFLEVVRRDRKFKEDGARKAMLAIFTKLGDENPITRTYRQKLANVLF